MNLQEATRLILDLTGVSKTFNTRTFSMEEMVKASKGEINSEVDAEKICRAVIASQQFNFADYEVRDSVFQKRDFSDFRIRLEVPSGIIVFTDCFRDIIKEHFPYDLKRGNDSISMKLDYMRKHEAKGMAHGYVGNTSPAIFWDDKNQTIYIGAGYTEESDYKELKNPELKKIGHICTDLWWYSFMDKSKYLEYGGKMNEDIGEFEIGKCALEFHHTWAITDMIDSLDCDTFATAKKVKEL